MHVQKRGGKFWLWADCLLKTDGHREQLHKGCTIDVQARVNRQGCTQLFIGVYDLGGHALCEEFYPRLLDETVDQALDWGTRRCDVLIDQTARFNAPHRISSPVTEFTFSLTVSADEADSRRESFLAASKSARAEFAQAKAALFSIMRDGHVDSRVRSEHVRRLNQAVDAWVSLPRQYVESSGDALNKRTPDRAPPYGGYLFVEEFEYNGLGVGFSGIEAR